MRMYIGPWRTSWPFGNGGYQRYDPDLEAFAGLSHADGNMPVGDGSTWVAESGATLRTSIGVGTTDDVTVNTLTVATSTRADAVSTTIGSAPQFIRTAGYATEGDGGGALYKRAATEPDGEFKFQSSDGAWWQGVIDPGGVNPRQLGAKGDGVADDTDALQNALDLNGVVVLPPGLYRITTPLIIDPARNRGNGFVGVGAPSGVPTTTQVGGPTWNGTMESVIQWDGADVDDLSSTSTTTMGIGAISRGFTVAAGKSFAVGQTVIVRRTSNPSTHYMYGAITAYNSTTGAMTALMTASAGTGTYSDWTVTVPTAIIAVSNAPIGIQPSNAFDDTPTTVKLHNLVLDGNDKVLYGLYTARVQQGDVSNITSWRARGDGFYITGAYSGYYRKLLATKCHNRGISIGAAELDYGWTGQSGTNGVTFLDLWAVACGSDGTFDEDDNPYDGCGVYFAPHRGTAIYRVTVELCDGIGIVWAPSGQGNKISTYYSELLSTNDLTGDGSAIETERTAQSIALAYVGYTGGTSYDNSFEGGVVTGAYLWLTGTEPSTSRVPPRFDGMALCGGILADWEHYALVNFDGEAVDETTGDFGRTHGEWTPTLRGLTTTGSPTYTLQQGMYSISDNLVTVSFRITLSDVGGMEGQMDISNLPLAVKSAPSGMQYAVTMGEWILAGAGTPVARAVGGTTRIAFLKDTGTGTLATLTEADMTDTSRLWGTVTYRYR